MNHSIRNVNFYIYYKCSYIFNKVCVETNFIIYISAPLRHFYFVRALDISLLFLSYFIFSSVIWLTVSSYFALLGDFFSQTFALIQKYS